MDGRTTYTLMVTAFSKPKAKVVSSSMGGATAAGATPKTGSEDGDDILLSGRYNLKETDG